MRDTRVEIRVYNKALYDAIFPHYKSIRAFAIAVHVGQSVVGNFLNLKHKKPFNKNGSYCAEALRISEFLQIDISTLFPKSLYEQPNEITVVHLESQSIACTDRSRFRKYLPETRLMDDAVRDALTEAMGVLSDKERKILTMRIVEDKTLDECGKEFNMTRQGAKIVEDRAFAKLHQPNILKKLEEVR